MTTAKKRAWKAMIKEPSIRNILLKVEYRGTDFFGWQRQSNRRTVQGLLEENLRRFLRHKVNIIGAGRTDAGVHALAQCANFVISSHITPDDIMYRLNRMLPDDIVVLRCTEVPLEFDARRHAIHRSYRYLISERLTAMHRHFSWALNHGLDLEALRSMASLVSKARHFDNFCKVKSRKASNVCRILTASWSRGNGFLRFDITADRFLHNMVRLLVGTMVAALDDRIGFERFKDMLDNRIDDKARYIAPACGLYLVAVGYERTKL